MSNQVRVMNFSARQMAMLGVPDLPLEAFGGMKPIPRAMRSQSMTLHKGGGLTAVVAVVAATYLSNCVANIKHVGLGGVEGEVAPKRKYALGVTPAIINHTCRYQFSGTRLAHSKP